MPSRKRRIPVVFDTNVIVGFYLSRNRSSANQQAFRLWRDQRQLQLIVSDDVVREYLEVLLRLNVPEVLIRRLEETICPQDYSNACQFRLAPTIEPRS